MYKESDTKFLNLRITSNSKKKSLINFITGWYRTFMPRKIPINRDN